MSPLMMDCDVTEVVEETGLAEPLTRTDKPRALFERSQSFPDAERALKRDAHKHVLTSSLSVPDVTHVAANQHEVVVHAVCSPDDFEVLDMPADGAMAAPSDGAMEVPANGAMVVPADGATLVYPVGSAAVPAKCSAAVQDVKDLDQIMPIVGDTAHSNVR